MAGTSYTRQSTLTDGDTITASLFNDEYNQLINAFAYAAAGTTGHQHDGGAGEGGNIEIIGDQDFKNKITVDSTNNRWSVFVEVGGTAVEQVRIEDGVVYPVTDSDVDLGTNALRFKNAYIDSLTATGNLTVGGNITVTGNVDVDGIVEFDGLSGTGSVTVTDILDQDDMSGDSATALATQQSIKAYVDAQQDTVDTLGEILALSNTTAGTDISVSTDDKVQFRDSAIYINSSADGQLDIVADTEIQIAATTIDINGAINASGEIIAASLDISGNIDVDGVTNLDVVDIDGAVDMASTLTVASNIVVGGTVDGRDVATDGTKLDGIEASATADQSNAEIRTAVEAASDSNVFTDADHTKLNAIEASADVTDVTNVTAAGALMDSEVTNLAEVKAFDSSDYATAAQGATAVAALPKAGGAMTGAITTNSTFDGRDVATDGSKLDGIEASADVTDAANVTAAGALMDSELTAIASVKALNQGVATGNSPTFTNLTLSGTSSVKVPAGTTAQRDGTPANGMFRYNSTNEQFEGYQNSEWGAIGGGGGSNTFTTDAFTGNGSTAAYALSQVINSENNLMVFIAGVFQQQSAYSIATASGTTTLTFSTAPANTREIVIYSIASAVSGSNLNIDSMTGDGSDVTLSLTIAPVNENNTQVFIDGVYQSKANYSISGTTLTFSTAPPTGSAVEVMTMTQTEVNVPVDGTITSAKLSGDLTLPGSLAFADNEKATFGAGDDLQIYHDGNHSYVKDAGTGRLYIQGTDGVRITNASAANMLSALSGDGVYAYHNANLRLATTATGIDVTGTVTIPDKIIHAGDTNTFLSFNAADQIQLVTGGVERVAFYNTETHFNESGADVNFIVESDGNANMLFVDGGNNRVGIGTSSPTADLEISSSSGTLKLTDSDGTEQNTTLNQSGGTFFIKARDNTANAPIVFAGNGGGTFDEHMRIDASGNLLVGKTDSSLDVEGTAIFPTFARFTRAGAPAVQMNRKTSDGDILDFRKDGTTVGSIGTKAGDLTIGDADVGLRFDTGAGLIPWNMTTIAATDGAIDIGAASARFKDLYLSGASYIPDVRSTGIQYFTHTTDARFRNASGTERMRINGSGNLLVGGTVSGAGAQSGICIDGGESDSNIFIRHANGTGTGSRYMAFTYNTSVIGSISQNGTSQVLFSISSDQRLKENIADADDAGSKIDAIQVRKYDWKADGSHQDYGMIAQELQAVAPEAVSGDADSEDMMGVDYSKLVPMLIKEIQSLRNRVATLEE